MTDETLLPEPDEAPEAADSEEDAVLADLLAEEDEVLAALLAEEAALEASASAEVEPAEVVAPEADEDESPADVLKRLVAAGVPRSRLAITTKPDGSIASVERL